MIDCEFIKLDDKVFLNVWAPVMHENRQLKIGEVKRCVLQLKQIEKRIQALNYLWPNVIGWAVWSYKDKPRHHKMILKLGAKVFQEVEDRTWFIKEIVQ